MTPTQKRLEIKRRANKESYQGDALKRRIDLQMGLLQKTRELETHHKALWLSSQLAILRADEELAILLAIHAKSLKKAK